MNTVLLLVIVWALPQPNDFGFQFRGPYASLQQCQQQLIAATRDPAINIQHGPIGFACVPLFNVRVGA